ncbi:hypothetical protein IscW_ISCW005925 [Ixodes scapularis]|uniref:Uncharacterized protein n=1 Tax=Ixodes scapularis TaxID=6945 RepID=B7PN93_IXOSC|nr:hypothetical protein IscW_ISCW005925 [Ixodes scapularis]|eukprot:XP_002435241.1 hypothetical protein IscW_ISCW005925 [Ixodes scapularis]
MSRRWGQYLSVAKCPFFPHTWQNGDGLLSPHEDRNGKLNVEIKTAFKSAPGVLEPTPTLWLMELGVHNTLEELRNAQISAQLKRLDRTANGR